jgi:D-alanyl-D-alanine dipeptidase
VSLLKTKPDAKSHEDRSAYRIFPVTAKLTKDERKAVTDFARSQGLARGQWMRDVILREMRGAPVSDTSLAEILGVRLLLVNVLRPLAAGQKLTPETFDKLLDDISAAKYELAGKLTSEKRR